LMLLSSNALTYIRKTIEGVCKGIMMLAA
jgi:hypothetical protein